MAGITRLRDLSPEQIAEIAGTERYREEVRELVASIASVSVEECARISGVSHMTIRRAVSAGELAHQRLGNRISIRLGDLKAWLDEHRYGAA